MKIAHKLSDKVMNPLALEKTNVMLADAAFHESTVNALKEFGKDFKEFLETAQFIEKVRNWWDRFNVKTPNKGHHKRNKHMEPITKDNINEFSNQMKEFSDWLKQWYSEYPEYCLTYQTYQALRQTVSATVGLCEYLLENGDSTGIGYILLGNLQQDFLEGRFGWWRQLSGANYYCQILQFLQAEKSIRLRNLVNSGYTMKEISKVFSRSDGRDEAALKEERDIALEMLHDFKFSHQNSDFASITYYVAGYISRQLTKKTKCKQCHLLLSNNGEPYSERSEHIYFLF